ncbi:MAG: membrane protein insertase YidC [Gammaproteobacteria bacterium]|nr:membrane protein insertase YidC [Gammaproteobacteria bacterium]
MENQRIILFFVLSFGLLLIWQGVQPPAKKPDTVATESTVAGAPAADVPKVASEGSGLGAAPAAAATISTGQLQSGQRIRIETDLFDAELDTVGGDVRVVALRKYPVAVDKPSVPFRLMEDGKLRTFIAQSGLISQGAAPDHHAMFTADKTEYKLAAGQDSLSVPLHWRSEDGGIEVTKTYTFKRNSYVIGLDQQVANRGAANWTGHQYTQFQRTQPGEAEKSRLMNTYTGGVIYSTEKKYEKISLDDMSSSNLDRSIENGWAAMIQHYFLGAWIPNRGEADKYYTKAPKDRPYVIGMISPEVSVAPGEEKHFDRKLYVGPKDQDRMAKVAEGLRLTVDYGVLTVLAQPIFWLMKHIHTLVGNWGWSIVILTLLIKLAFFKLSAASYRSMANMRKMTPKIQSIRERYGDDRQRMSQAMMELYKTEKINPLGGCLPILVQIPVFIALYWVLLESVELRQAPFIFWIHDMSAKDPYYVLPILMGITMFIQQKLNPPPPDPVQAKVMMSLPFIFTLFFAFFPSGLVIYWVTNSTLSILQQWYITRKIEAAA